MSTEEAGTHAIVRPSTDKFDGYTHTDGGEGLREIRVTETSRPLAMKALYLLSDVTEEDAGAFTVYPGSHMRRFPQSARPPFRPGSYFYVPTDQEAVIRGG